SEPEPEAAALAGAVVQVLLGLGLLFARERLRVREPDAPAPFLDREHEDFELDSRGKRLAVIGPALGTELGVGHQPGLARAGPDERAVVLHALDGARQHRAHRA